MNLKALYIASVALGSLALTACDDDWTRPPMEYGVFPEGLEANMTINELKTLYWQNNNSYGTEIGTTADGDPIIIMGTVTNTDKQGAFSKLVIVQDATGSIAFAINQKDLCYEFPRGSMVAVNMTGLTFGRFNGQEQTGAMVNGSVNRISLEEFKPHTWQQMKGGEIDTLDITLDELAGMRSDADKVKWESQLVRIKNVHFADPGEYFAPGTATSRTVTDDNGARLDVRTSQYSELAWDKIPEGTGEIIGFITLYKENWQFVLCDRTSLVGFDAAKSSLTLLPGNDPDGLRGWTIENVGTERTIWTWASYSGSYYLNGTAFGSTVDTESWAISPVIDLSGVTGATAQFNQACKFQTTIKDLCKFCVRAEGETDWTDLPITMWPENDNKWTWALSDKFDLSAYDGRKIQLAFKYAGSPEGSDQWEIRNLKVSGEGDEITADIPDVPVQPGVVTMLDEPLAGSFGEFTVENINLDGLARVWAEDTKYKCALATGFLKEDKTNHAVDAWLVSPEIDLTGVKAPTVSFDHAVNYFSSLEVAKTQATLGVRVDNGAWLPVAIPVYGSNADFTFVNSGEIDLSEFIGKKIQIGFHYTSTAAKAGTWEVKNVKVNATKE